MACEAVYSPFTESFRSVDEMVILRFQAFSILVHNTIKNVWRKRDE